MKGKVNPLGLKRLEVFYEDITCVHETVNPEAECLQPISALGYFVCEDEKVIKIAADYIKDYDDVTYRGLSIIPKSLLVERKEI